MPPFGDWDPDDAYDPAPPDPEQVAIRLHRLRDELGRAGGHGALPRWEALDSEEELVAIWLTQQIIDWLRRQGAVR